MTSAKRKKLRHYDLWLRRMALMKVKEAVTELEIAESDLEGAREALDDARKQYKAIIRKTQER